MRKTSPSEEEKRLFFIAMGQTWCMKESRLGARADLLSDQVRVCVCVCKTLCVKESGGGRRLTCCVIRCVRVSVCLCTDVLCFGRIRSKGSLS